MSELSVRQYLHNDGSGLTLGYDKSEADAIINDLRVKLEAVDKASTNLADRLVEQRIQIAELEKQTHDMVPLWHKVSDCNPPENTRVLVFVGSTTRPCVTFIQIDTYTREDDFGSTRVPRFRTYGDYVTHWMPLPKEP